MEHPKRLRRRVGFRQREPGSRGIDRSSQHRYIRRHIYLTTTVETFNVVNFNANNTSGTIALDADLIEIYKDSNIGSARGAAGFDAGVSAGTIVYDWTLSTVAPPNADYRRIDAAGFAVVPEPSTALLGSLGLLCLLRRRR